MISDYTTKTRDLVSKLGRVESLSEIADLFTINNEYIDRLVDNGITRFKFQSIGFYFLQTCMVDNFDYLKVKVIMSFLSPEKEITRDDILSVFTPFPFKDVVITEMPSQVNQVMFYNRPVYSRLTMKMHQEDFPVLYKRYMINRTMGEISGQLIYNVH